MMLSLHFQNHRLIQIEFSVISSRSQYQEDVNQFPPHSLGPRAKRTMIDEIAMLVGGGGSATNLSLYLQRGCSG